MATVVSAHPELLDLVLRLVLVDRITNERRNTDVKGV